MSSTRSMRASWGIRRLIAATAALATLAACAPAVPAGPTDTTSTTTTTTKPGSIDPELEALLTDPKFTAQFGDTDQDRADIIAETRKILAADAEWPVDSSVRELVAADKAAADEAARKKEIEAAAAEAQKAFDERKRLDALQQGPELADIASATTDGSENFDYTHDLKTWEKVEGFTDTRTKVEELRKIAGAKVDEAIKRLRAEGTYDEAIATPGYVPPEGKGDAMFEAIWADIRDRGPVTGACADRVGNRAAPAAGLRPGTIYSPYQNTFAGDSGSPTHVGQLKTTTIGGKKHFIVEGHLGDLDTLGFFVGIGSIQTVLRARLTVHTPGNIVPDYDGWGPFMHLWAPGTPIASGDVQVLCYTTDFSLPTGSEIRRAMFRAYIPFDPEGHQLGEPGFQVRATVSEQNDAPAFFFGSDMRTVYLGSQPLGYNSTFTGGGFGVSAGKGVIVDDNSITGDDLESSIRTPVGSALTNAISGLDGASDWVWGKKGGSWGWFGFHVNNSNPGTPNVDIDWNQTSYAGAGDDEYRLKGSVSMNDWLIEGYASVPFALLGIVPCYWRMKVDFSASIYASVNVSDTARTILQPNLELGPLGLNVHNMFVSPLPLGCNFLYTAAFADRWVTKVNGLLPSINATLSGQLQNQPNLPSALPATVSIGGGQNMQVLFAGWNDTCAPYGCNGGGAGDVAMSWAGLEATGDFRFTDTKAPSATRRFPVSYSPTTGDTANGRVRQHFGAQNEITDLGAWISPTMLNQALRVIGEQGRLDIQVDPTTPGSLKSPPVYLSTPIAADKPLGLFVPHLEIDPVGPNLFAADMFAAVGVGFDSGTRKLVPSPLGPNDPGLGVALWTLNCDGTLWATCYGVPALASGVLNWAANSIVNPLLQNSIGQVTIPNTGSLSLTGLQIVNEDGHLGIRASVGAAQLRAWGSMDQSTYSFDTFWEGLPGTGPVTYTWSIKDDISGATIFTATSQQWQYNGFATSALAGAPLPFSSLHLRSATATITATRGGVSKTATHTDTVIS